MINCIKGTCTNVLINMHGILGQKLAEPSDIDLCNLIKLPCSNTISMTESGSEICVYFPDETHFDDLAVDAY